MPRQQIMHLERLDFVPYASCIFPAHFFRSQAKLRSQLLQTCGVLWEFRVHWCWIYLRVDRSRRPLSKLEEFTPGTRAYKTRAQISLITVYIVV